MAHTNSTPNYGLPQFIGDDKPTFLGDMNGAFSDIDTAMKANEVSAQEANAGVATNAGAITGLQGTVGGLDTRLTAVEGVAAGNTGNINTINSLIGNGEPTTTDKTLIGAINELNSDKVDSGNIVKLIGESNVSVTADGTKTYSTLLNEAYNAFAQMLASLNADEYVIPLSIYLTGIGSYLSATANKKYNSNTSDGLKFLSTIVSVSDTFIYIRRRYQRTACSSTASRQP